MAERADDLQQNIEETRQDIEDTRASLTEKLGLLEERVRETLEETKSAVEDIVENVKGTVDETVGAVKETVDGAKSTVEDIVENVKGTMDDTVTTVKQAFDLSYQVNQHPWLMVGGSVLLGSFLGGLSQRRSRSNRYAYNEDYNGADPYAVALAGGPKAYADTYKEGFTKTAESPAFTQTPRYSQRWSGLGQFQEEFDIIKSAIIGTMMGTLREMVRQNMPRVAPTLEKAIDSASHKLGAEPIEPSQSSQHSDDDTQKEHTAQSTTGSQPPSTPSPSRQSSGQQQRSYGTR
jgi:ElaB/YqjD/DUF883 family membrane-anchored ribosome-binding protein